MKKISIVTVILAAISLAGCAGFGGPDASDAELVAAAALEFQSVRQVELADGGEAALLSDSPEEAARALAADNLVGARALGDPSPLVEDLGNNRIRVTATWTNDDGLAVVSVIERDRRPAASSYDGSNALVTTTGTETRTVEGVTVRNSAVSIEWKWDGQAAYYKYRLTRTGETLRNLPQVGVSTIVEWDASGALVSRSVSWLKLDSAGSPTLRSVTYSPLLDGAGAAVLNADGVPELKMFFSDRAGWAVLVDKSPRTVEYYREDGSLSLRVTHDPTPGVPGVALTREYFDLDGNPLKTVTGNLKLSMNDGALTLVREVGSRKVTATVSETESGLSVDYNGQVWTLVQNEDGSLDLTGPDGSTFHVAYGPDGTPSIS